MLNKTITPKARRALEILATAGEPLRGHGMTANTFDTQYYAGTKNEYLLTAVSNQGEGACAGKKAWLCAGSYLCRLAKQGLVYRHMMRDGKVLFFLSEKGREALKL
jgi:predicted metal-binding transcription factor (methanogenesis marker protein 9)